MTRCIHGVYLPPKTKSSKSPGCQFCTPPIALSPEEIQHYKILEKTWK
jgi:hypothetical protein